MKQNCVLVVCLFVIFVFANLIHCNSDCGCLGIENSTCSCSCDTASNYNSTTFKTGATFSKFGVWNLSSNGVNDTSFFISIRNQDSIPVWGFQSNAGFVSQAERTLPLNSTISNVPFQLSFFLDANISSNGASISVVLVDASQISFFKFETFASQLRVCNNAANFSVLNCTPLGIDFPVENGLQVILNLDPNSDTTWTYNLVLTSPSIQPSISVSGTIRTTNFIRSIKFINNNTNSITSELFIGNLNLCLINTSNPDYTPLGIGATDVVWAIQDFKNEIYIGGDFLFAGGQFVNFISKWNGSSWLPLLGDANTTGVNARVFALAEYKGLLYVGGNFTRAGNEQAKLLAKWNGTNWFAMNSQLNLVAPAPGAMPAYVKSLKVFNSILYVGGSLLSFDNVSRNVAGFDGTNWVHLNTGLPYGGSTAIEFWSKSLWVGNDAWWYLYSFSGTNWYAYGGIGYANGNWLLSMAADEKNLYIGGQIGGAFSGRLIKRNSTNMVTVVDDLDGPIYNLKFVGTDLYLGGKFTYINGSNVNNIAKFDGKNFSSAGNVNGQIQIFHFAFPYLYIGGYFTTANGKSVNRIVKYGPLSTYSATQQPNIPTTSTPDSIDSFSTSSDDDKSVAIGVGVTFGLIAVILAVLLVIFVILFLRRRNQQTKRQDEGTLETAAIATPTSNSPGLGLILKTKTRISDSAQKYVVKYEELKLNQKLGVGAFGEVWKATYRNAIVAVKQISSKLDLNDKTVAEFVNECEIMIKIKPHPNVVQVMALCLEPLCIVMELASKGSLDKVLQNKDRIFEFYLKINWMKQIAAGMSHLHAEGIVHKDLAARNVLLTETETCKISDLGLSRALNPDTQQHTSMADIGPLKWMAPESLVQSLYSPKSDVWTFGVTCVEILTQDLPYPSWTPSQYAVKFNTLKLIDTIPKSNTPEWLILMIEQTQATEPSQRPTFDKLVLILSQEVDKDTKSRANSAQPQMNVQQPPESDSQKSKHKSQGWVSGHIYSNLPGPTQTNASIQDVVVDQYENLPKK